MTATSTNPTQTCFENKQVEELYEDAFPAVARLIHKLGGSYADARDIFHDALVIFQEKAADPGFTLTQAPAAYVIGIAKHLWLRGHRHDKGRLPLTELEKSLTLPEDYFPEVNSLMLLNLLERTGRKCLNMLRAFYYQNLPMHEVAARFGFRTTHSATVQKYKCLEKARQTIKEKAISYADFLN